MIESSLLHSANASLRDTSECFLGDLARIDIIFACILSGQSQGHSCQAHGEDLGDGQRWGADVQNVSRS